jgi:hypothetical protein
MDSLPKEAIRLINEENTLVTFLGKNWANMKLPRWLTLNKSRNSP